MRQARQGIAIVMVLLISAVVLITFLAASATLTISSRSSAASSRESAQALLAADSGLNTLKARASATPYQTSDGTFKDWIEGNFGTLDLGDGVEAALTVVAETSPTATQDGSVTIQSVGTVGTSKRTVVQAFKTKMGPPVPASANVPGALTSVATIKSDSGSALVKGKEDTVADWETSQIPTLGKSSTTYRPATVCDAKEGEYVVISGIVYKVAGPVDPTDCSGNVDLVQVDNGTTVQEPLSTDATIRATAITESLTVDTMSSPPTSKVTVTPGTQSLFSVGFPITIGDAADGTASIGTVTGVDDTDPSNPILTVQWDNAPAGSPPEGTVVRRKILSGVTGGSCDLNKDYTFPQGCQQGADLKNLFYQTFGVSPDLLYNSLDASHKLSGDDPDYSTEIANLSGITWVTGPPNNFRDQTGSGILIIQSDPGQQVSLNVSNTFTGLIYIIGDAKIEGNAQYDGAIIVDGTATITKVQGTPNISYDPLQLLRALAGITFPNPNPGGLGAAIADTWRIR